ncbi:MAG: cytochrome c biogenesis protein CcsA, partial [Verrucomicrobia bacterium]|nr:cytochrome c biogenesis protein CcsA [Verrucomicrobiota bacterium]
IPFVTLILIAGIQTPAYVASMDPGADTVWLGIHVLSAVIGYALFSLTGILAVVYLVQDRNLKHKQTGRIIGIFPPLETLDQVIGRQVGFGFLMLTLSIVTGVLLIHLNGGGVEWLSDPKIIAITTTWGVYAVLVHLRGSGDRHGKSIAVVTLIGFVCVLFGFIGIHAVADSVHEFDQWEQVAQP